MHSKCHDERTSILSHFTVASVKISWLVTQQDLGISVGFVFTTVADPGFHKGNANTRGGGKNILFGKFYAEKCMKLKGIEPRGSVATSNKSDTDNATSQKKKRQ